VRLPRTAGTDDEDVLSLVEVVTLNELQQEWLIDAGPVLEVEFIEQLMRGETGGLQQRWCRAMSWSAYTSRTSSTVAIAMTRRWAYLTGTE
jgi:hypothetical protein